MKQTVDEIVTRRINAYWSAVFKLLVSGVIWGLSFTLVRWALVDFSTSQLLLLRFGLAFILGEALMRIFSPDLYKKSHGDMKLAMFSGLALGLSLLFQIHGLNFTTATKSGFITTTYVVMIPFIAYLFFKQKIKITDVLLAVLAVVGMSFLLDLFSSLQSFNSGDILTIFSAVTAAFQIIFVGIYSKKCTSAFRFNNYQILWSIPAIVPFMIYEINQKHIGVLPSHAGWLSILSVILLVLFVSLLAFYLQISAQKKLPTSTASMLCLLEAPFSYFFASLFLAEKLTITQGVGAIVILLSAFLSVYFESAVRE